MDSQTKIIDRQVGRNAQLFAQAIGEMPTPADRFPYLRILISVIESAHADWSQAPGKDKLIADLSVRLSDGTLDGGEVAEVVRVRDLEA